VWRLNRSQRRVRFTKWGVWFDCFEEAPARREVPHAAKKEGALPPSRGSSASRGASPADRIAVGLFRPPFRRSTHSKAGIHDTAELSPQESPEGLRYCSGQSQKHRATDSMRVAFFSHTELLSSPRQSPAGSFRALSLISLYINLIYAFCYIAPNLCAIACVKFGSRCWSQFGAKRKWRPRWRHMCARFDLNVFRQPESSAGIASKYVKQRVALTTLLSRNLNYKGCRSISED